MNKEDIIQFLIYIFLFFLCWFISPKTNWYHFSYVCFGWGFITGIVLEKIKKE